MRPQEERRFSDEAFYFDKGELVVDPEVLPEAYPEAILLEGRNVIATYTDQNGAEQTNEYTIGWAYDFGPGSLISSIQTSDSELAIQWADGLEANFNFSGGTSAVYNLKPTDQLILVAGLIGPSPEKVRLHPATEALPGTTQETWRLAGIINPNDKLITWKSDYKRWLTELALANTLMKNGVDYFHISDELGIERSLIGSINCQEAVSAYLEYFDKKHGTTFLPVRDPYEHAARTEHKPAFLLSNAQFNRYYRATSKD